MAEASGDRRSLEFTPTWALAAVTSTFVAFSLLLTFGIEKTEQKLKDAHRKALVHAIVKMKEELMLMGFISLLLTVFQEYLLKICIKASILDQWTPCHAPQQAEELLVENDPHRRLLNYNTWPLMDWGNEPVFHGRILAGGQSQTNTCKPGHDSLLSEKGLSQLHIFIFLLACVHLVYSLVAMGLASLKVSRLRGWEDEAQMHYDKQSNVELLRSLTLRQQATFLKYHTSKRWSRNQLAVWAVCFFRQFGQPVTKADYLTLRAGFITNHEIGKKFDFQSYICRSLDDEFPEIVGISFPLWIFMVLFLLFNINGTNLYFWLALVPIVVILAMGAKLQHIIATLALEHTGINMGGHFAGQNLKLRNELFWFSKPHFILWLIYFVFFQNAFEMTMFFWSLWQFGFHSCLLRNKAFVYIRIGLGIATQIVCSYNTLPLYAIVTQMGSNYKGAIFRHHVRAKLRNWRKSAQKRARLRISSERVQRGSSYFGNSSQNQLTDDRELGVHSSPLGTLEIEPVRTMECYDTPSEEITIIASQLEENPFNIGPSMERRSTGKDQ